MFKKTLITLCVLAVLTGAVLGIRALNENRGRSVRFAAVPDETETDNASLEIIREEGLFLAAENDTLKLYIDASDGNIEVVHKADGFVWRSRPTEEEMALETSNALWKNNLCSPVMFTYTTQATSTDTKYTNPLSQESRITLYRLSDGVRVFLEFLESSVTFGYDLRLKDDCLQVDLPPSLISDPGEIYKTNASGVKTLDKKSSCLLVDFCLFPSLGATRSDDGHEGSLLIPDGTGALMDFQSDKYAASQFISHIYGADMALYNGYDTKLSEEREKPVVNFPVFGVIRDGHTMMAVIDEGETQADIVASKAGVQTGFNTVTARFAYRMKYKVITNAASGTGYLSYTDFCVAEMRRIQYYFGSGTYVDMAKCYREYLMDKYALHPIDPGQEPAALQINLVGGDIESGVAGRTFIPMTSFTEAEEILRFFKEQGIEAIDAVYTGWGKWGESTAFPDRFPAASALGGDNGLTALCEAAREMGVSLYLKDDHHALDSHRGVSVARSAIYNIQNNPLFDGVFSNAAYTLMNYENSLSRYQRYQISGIEESGIGNLLIADYSRAAPTTREQMKQSNRAVLLKMRDDFGSIRLSSGRAWELMDHALLTHLDPSSNLAILDESVPFYPIALHGLVDYLYGDYMDFYEPRMELLSGIAQGGMISFTLSAAGTEKLARADSAAYYSTEFSLWKEDVLRIWQEMEEYLACTHGQMISDYIQPSPGVTLTVYENGAQVWVNHTDMPYTAENGDVLEALSFRVLKGGN